MTNKFAVIVDAYSTGAQLAPKFGAEGVTTLHVQTTFPVPEVFTDTYHPDHHLANIPFQNLQHCLAQLRCHLGDAKPLCVVAGTETGIEVADLLAEHYGLPGNAVASSRARRDKYEMGCVLRNAGLATPRFLRTDNLAELTAWALDQTSWPIVLKPLASAGNDNVFFCHSETELATAFSTMLGKINRLGERNCHVLAQTYLRGQQYLVNSVSIDGQHYISDIWADHRETVPGASNIYDYEELLAAEGALQNDILDYLQRALDALGVRNGPAHSELMMLDDGPVLIETGARMHGGLLEGPVIGAIGESQITLTIERYCYPDKFVARLQQPYRLARHVMCVALTSRLSGVVTNLAGLERICALPSYAAHSQTPTLGDRIMRTTDLFTIAGVLYLSHVDPAVLRRDYDTVRQLEHCNTLFAVRETGDA